MDLIREDLCENMINFLKQFFIFLKQNYEASDIKMTQICLKIISDFTKIFIFKRNRLQLLKLPTLIGIQTIAFHMLLKPLVASPVA